jgi:protein TonB
MGIVGAMHVGAFFLIARSLGIIPSEPLRPDIEATFYDPPARPIERVEPIEPNLEPRHTVNLPIPEVPPTEATSETTIAAQFVDPAQLTQQLSGTADPMPYIVSAHQDARHPLSQPPYPAPDIRLGNEGNADVEVYVLPNGRVGDARIARSTGFERLDRSAIEEAKRNWKLIPATRDGQPIAQWYKVRVTFKITSQ